MHNSDSLFHPDVHGNYSSASICIKKVLQRLFEKHFEIICYRDRCFLLHNYIVSVITFFLFLFLRIEISENYLVALNVLNKYLNAITLKLKRNIDIQHFEG